MLERVLRVLTRLQTTRPWLLLCCAALSLAIAGFSASKLTLKTSFSELLPQNKDSVIVADKVSERLVSASTLVVVAQGEHKEALEEFVDELAPEIRALGPGVVGAVDDGVKASQKFFKDNQLLYAPLADLQKIHDEILDRYDYEVAKQAGTLLDDSDAPPPITEESIKQRMEERRKAAAGDSKPNDPKYPDGYYMEPDGKFIALLIRTPVSSGDIDRSRVFLARIQEVIDRVDPKRFDPAMRINFTGDFITSAEEYNQIKGDLSHVGMMGGLMIFAIVFLYFLRLRTLLVMALTVGIGVVWTFGLAYLTVGRLNSSTGFLFSIILGNGINYGIIYMARYLEARRSEGVERSVELAHRDTWLSTLAAAGAATVAYGSLVITDFRGFKHFGFIGGTGMLLCWTATYVFLPAILVVTERIWALKPSGGLLDRYRSAYGRPFAFLAVRFPRPIMTFAIVTGVIALGLTTRYVLLDPMEYDMSNTRNKPVQIESNARLLARRVDKVVGRLGQDGLAIMVDRLDQVLPLKAALDARREEAHPDHLPFQRVVTIFDLLPSDQEKKLALIEDVRDRLQRAHRRGLVKDTDFEEVQKQLPPKGRPALGIDDLPEQVARSFVEKDGTRGRLVYIVPSNGRSVWDAHYLIEWADSFRTTTLPDGSVIKGSGRSVIFADMILAVLEDAPKAILASLLGTLLIVAITFRGRRAFWGAAATLVLGLAWMLAMIALHESKLTPRLQIDGMKLNFLNFVALPITIGVGAEYAVNVLQRYRILGRGSVAHAVRETGGAVVLCSLTTTLGYFALTFSVNKATISFGFAAAAGEIACVLAAVLVLPAFLVWREQRGGVRRTFFTIDEHLGPRGDHDGGERVGSVADDPKGRPERAPADVEHGREDRDASELGRE